MSDNPLLIRFSGAFAFDKPFACKSITFEFSKEFNDCFQVFICNVPRGKKSIDDFPEGIDDQEQFKPIEPSC